MSDDDLVITAVDGSRAAEVLAIVHESFANRPPLDPPATALAETEESIRRALDGYGGLLVEHEGVPVGSLLFEERGRLLGVRRVGVLERVRGLGVAAQLASRAFEVAAERHLGGVELEARMELPRTLAFWRRMGYVESGRNGNRITMLRLLPVTRRLESAEETRAYGAWLAGLLQAGDVVLLTGDLGAGKTTLTQGIGDGLGVRGLVTSPTFVIARVHPSTSGGPALVHVDAYRLGDRLELDDLDLDTDVDRAVTVVEWGEGRAEGLADSRLQVDLAQGHADGLSDDGTEARTLTLTPVGPRWRDLHF